MTAELSSDPGTLRTQIRYSWAVPDLPAPPIHTLADERSRFMSSEGLHAPRDRLTKETLSMHHAIVSLMEEIEAVDWYRQRADDCEDEQLREILLHNMREEMEHAAMVLEWIRRNNADFAHQLRSNLFTEGRIAGDHDEEG